MKEIKIGKTKKFKIRITPLERPQDYEVSSSDTSIATIEGNTINFIGKGQVDITATLPQEKSQDNTVFKGATYTIRFNVVDDALPTPSSKEIFYTTTDESIINVLNNFGNNYINSNTYDGDYGIILFEADVVTIGSGAFSGVPRLTSISLPEYISTIQYSAFSGCSGLKTITIPKRVRSIEKYVFNQCTNLSTITCLPTTPPSIVNTSFYLTNIQTIYVPSSAVEAYKASAWNDVCSNILPITD